MKVTREELLKIAQISQLEIHEDEIPTLLRQLESVLSYAARVTEIARPVENIGHTQINVFRDDVVIRTHVEPILNQAPEREETYFVVPKVIESAS